MNPARQKKSENVTSWKQKPKTRGRAEETTQTNNNKKVLNKKKTGLTKEGFQDGGEGVRGEGRLRDRGVGGQKPARSFGNQKQKNHKKKKNLGCDYKMGRKRGRDRSPTRDADNGRESVAKGAGGQNQQFTLWIVTKGNNLCADKTQIYGKR